MSAICSVCLETIEKPDTIWYAGTRFSWNVQWVCGTCIAKIPEEHRESTNSLRLHDLSFGVLHASTNSQGVYQGMDSTQGPIAFWVRADNIEKVFPEDCDCLCSLYPFYRIDEYLLWLCGLIRSGVYDGPEAAKKLQNTLLLIGRAAESHLLNRKENDIERKGFSPYSLPDNLSDEQNAQTKDLKRLILERYEQHSGG